ncbi:long-chain fatty acid--CoA ligase [Xylanibacillus composti]|uniref:Long-chain fatty acid--CoA ligase n=1 Tax=Xylanibacillus composti TaxID=1572762 RepID=A0A8J4H6D4_9BACL|nr:fatty acid--CoA ligase family protein [Xylanibacillus composti]MDT9726750.1 long-chain fatty acid--CoA ligase [Xylanibacillus composti]GIQ69318.1 hypothetical protein XYCOK13_21420 [Xylanibacillus composti]
MDTEQFLTVLSGHSGACFLFPSGDAAAYESLTQAIAWNVERLRESGYGSRGGKQQVIACQISLGWRAVPVLLAAMQCRVTVVPVDSFRNPQLTRKALEEIGPELVIAQAHVDQTGRLQALPTVFPKRRSSLQDVALILYTSGTSGFPKGVMLTYRNLWSNMEDILRCFPLGAEDRLLLLRPLVHASAITGELLPALYCGAAIAVKPDELTPLGAVRELAAQRITVCCMTPTVASSLAHFAPRCDMSTVQQLVLSGEPLRKLQKERIRAAFPGARIGNAYGLTEASPRVSCKLQLADDDPVECVGAPLARVDIRIVDGQGNPVSPGCRGMLTVSGPNVMKGYFGDAAATAVKLDQGWLKTGDIASWREGELFVYGRADDLIIRGGVNVHPAELEQVLLEVEGVREALAFGHMEDSGVKIHAWVTADPELDRHEVLRRIVQNQQDTRLWPDVIEVKRELPKTASGKVMRPRG